MGKPSLEIVSATREMIDMLAGNLRPEHLAEIGISFGVSDRNYLILSFGMSDLCWCVMGDRGPVCAFGVVAEAHARGRAWMLGSEEIDRYPVWFLRKSREMIRRMHFLSGCTFLENWVPVCYEKALRWLRWCGWWTHDEPIPMGPMGQMHVNVWHTAEPLEDMRWALR